MTSVDDAITAIKSFDLQAIQAEVDELRAIRTWALEQIGVDFTAGDRVVIRSSKPSKVGHGWASYREALAIGQTGIAGEPYFNQSCQRWQVLVGMDRAGSIHESHDGTVTRYWRGPADETPDGYEPPSAFDQERHPNGVVKHFALDLAWIAKATS